MTLDVFAGASFATYILVLCRIGGIFVMAPVFASKLVPMRLRLVLALAISLVAMPHAAEKGVQLDPYALAPLVFKELLLGTALAFGVAGVFAAVEMAGSLIDTTIGFSLANVIDPAMGFQTTVTAQLYGLVASMVFLATGAHHVLIAGLVRSFDTMPVSEMPSAAQLGTLATSAIAPLFVTALQIASPVVATLFVTDVAFGILARLVPQLQPMAVQFSVKVVVGLGALLLALPVTITVIGDRYADVLSQMGFIGP